MQVEQRIGLTREQQKKFDDNWASIDGMEERKKEVLERCRREMEKKHDR